ncbi:MAG: pitrilysin family protein [Mariprofundaceae bacterium]
MRRIKCMFLSLILSFIPLAAHAVPEIQQARLDNGLRVLLMEAHNIPMVSMSLSMVAGSRFDPQGKGGSAALMAEMLSDHTATHDNEAWADYLDAEAIRLGAGAGRDTLGFSLMVLKEALGEGVAALAESLLRPGWDKGRFTIIREDAVSSAEKAREDPGDRARERLTEVLFGSHPYGHRSGGNVESLGRIDIDDMKSLYDRQVRPEGAVLAVSGDITMPELLKVIAPLLADWKGKPESGLLDLDSPEMSPASFSVEMDSTQAHLMFGRLGPTRQDKDILPALLVNHILGGGGFGSVLMEEVREKRGLAYSVYSYFQPLAVSGPYVINLQTRADQAGMAGDVVREVLADMFEHGVSRKQLDDAKANMIGGFAQKIDSNRERVGLMTMIGMYGLPLDYLSTWTERIKALSLEDVRKVAVKYLDPKAWTLVQVGPRQAADTP